MPSEIVSVRDQRSLPFYWIQRTLLDVIQPTSSALLAYNALAYFVASDSRCKSIEIAKLAEKVQTSADTIRRGLKELETKRAIKIKHKFKTVGANKQSLPNEYILIDLSSLDKKPI